MLEYHLRGIAKDEDTKKPVWFFGLYPWMEEKVSE